MLVDPDDEEAFAAAWCAWRRPGTSATRLVAAGRARAARFTWTATAKAVDGLLGDLLA